VDLTRIAVATALAAAPLTLHAGQAGALQPLTVMQFEGGATRPAAQALQHPVTAGGLQPLAITQIDARKGHPELDTQRLSLAFASPTPIRDILMLLVRDTGLSVIPDPKAEGDFVGDLKNVTVRQALDLILEPLGLDYSIRSEIIRVFPRELETRLFSIDYVITQRSGSRSMNASTSAAGGGVPGQGGGGAGSGGSASAGGGSGGGSGGGGGTSSQVSGSDAPNVYGDLIEGVRTLLSADGRMNLDRTAALLQVTDRPSRLDRIDQYLAKVMLRVHRQVQIEAKVIEVELRDQFSAGINWKQVIGSLKNSLTISQTTAPATSGGFTMSLNIGDFSGLLNAFATQGKVNVLSSPRVTAMNNQPAIIRIGTQDVFFITTTQTDPQTGQIIQSTVSPQSLTEGVVLSVTAQVSADGIIHMSLNPSITERTGVATSRLGDTVPIVSVRETDTLVRVREGETVVIAGLMQDRMTNDVGKVPLLGDLPAVGGLFRRTERGHRKTDLVILLTPTLLGAGQIPENAASEIRRIDTAKAAGETTR
jgi:MSHA biogenesis protein MshL